MSHTVGMQTTNYPSASSGQARAARLPVVLQDGENTYVYGLDPSTSSGGPLISATDDQDDQTYFLHDGLGSVTDVTDENGDVVASYSYDVFGAIRSQAGSSDNYWLFTGEQHDADSDLYYLDQRPYDPAIGRYLVQAAATTAVTYPLSMNGYLLKHDNPISSTERSASARSGINSSCGRVSTSPVGRASAFDRVSAFLNCTLDCMCPSFGLGDTTNRLLCATVYLAMLAGCLYVCSLVPLPIHLNPGCYICIGAVLAVIANCVVHCSGISPIPGERVGVSSPRGLNPSGKEGSGFLAVGGRP